jgi:hypothetical protein
MTFPLTISDKYTLERFVSVIARYSARQVLLQTGQIRPTLSLAECYRLASRRTVDGAIKMFKLHPVKKGERVYIRREEFERWWNTSDFMLE